jgi:hypothetical protein
MYFLSVPFKSTYVESSWLKLCTFVVCIINYLIIKVDELFIFSLNETFMFK